MQYNFSQGKVSVEVSIGQPLKYTGLGLMFATTDTPKALALQEGVGLVGGAVGKRMGTFATSSSVYSTTVKEYTERIMELYMDKTSKYGCGVLIDACR